MSRTVALGAGQTLGGMNYHKTTGLHVQFLSFNQYIFVLTLSYLFYFNDMVNRDEVLLICMIISDQHLRLAVRMVGRESYSSEVLHSTIMLLLLKPSVAQKNSTSICYGLFELIRASIGSEISYENWRIIFAQLEMAGAGTKPPTVVVRVVEPVSESETTLVEGAGSSEQVESEQATTPVEDGEKEEGAPEADSGRRI